MYRSKTAPAITAAVVVGIAVQNQLKIARTRKRTRQTSLRRTASMLRDFNRVASELKQLELGARQGRNFIDDFLVDLEFRRITRQYQS